MSEVIHADDSTLENAIASKGRVLLKFSAGWCRPCKVMEPIFKAVAASTENVACIEVDSDASPEGNVRYGIRGLPTFILLDGDREVKRHTGTLTKEQLMGWLEG